MDSVWGKRLKLFQREQLLPLGVEAMFWTFDPLVARNANLNLKRLGALPAKFERNMYGEDTGSDLHSGLGTDRFVVEWLLASPRVEELLSAERESRSSVDELPPSAECVVAFEGGVPNVKEPPPKGRRFIEVPHDIERLKREDFDCALAWRGQRARCVRIGLCGGLSFHRLGARTRG